MVVYSSDTVVFGRGTRIVQMPQAYPAYSCRNTQDTDRLGF